MWGTILQFLLSFALNEATKLWKDGTVKGMAETAINYAGNTFLGDDDKDKALRAKVARNHLIGEAKNAGLRIGKSAANIIIEKAVQRFLKS